MLTIYRDIKINTSLNTIGSIETTLSIAKIKILDDHLLVESPKQSDNI